MAGRGFSWTGGRGTLADARHCIGGITALLEVLQEDLSFIAVGSGTMPPRILIAKPGLDGHDRGAKVVARALRDAGCEVIYSGLHQTPEQIVEAAIQEDVEAIGLSALSGAHMTLFPRVVEVLRERGVSDIRVFGGGIIPEGDIPVLEAAGLVRIFTPGTTLAEITRWVEQNVTSG